MLYLPIYWFHLTEHRFPFTLRVVLGVNLRGFFWWFISIWMLAKEIKHISHPFRLTDLSLLLNLKDFNCLSSWYIYCVLSIWLITREIKCIQHPDLCYLFITRKLHSTPLNLTSILTALKNQGLNPKGIATLKYLYSDIASNSRPYQESYKFNLQTVAR